MKKETFPAPAALDRACRGFSLLGFWQANRVPLLAGAAVIAAVVVLLLWLSRRRRRDAFPEIRAEGQDRSFNGGLTQVEAPTANGALETAGAGGARRPAPSPGIHGRIEVLVGGQPISSYLVTDNPLPIGRDPGQSLVVIQEPIVSKLHCQIFARGGQVFVKDLNSTNGVYVSEEKIAERELQDGDVVFLGKKGTVRIIYHR
jgi:hypothetical protein